MEFQRTSPREMKPKPQPLLNRSKYKIGIICALGKEANAVRSSFDHIFLHPRERPRAKSGDRNTYSFGIIGRHHVVLATIGGDGNVKATDAANHMERSFQNIKLCLLVGTCGIVPKINSGDTFLGDVVMSQEIIYYTKGKYYPTGHKTEQMLAKAPEKMVRGFEELRSPQKWRAFCEEVHLKLMELSEDEFIKELRYEYPGRQHDKLYHENYLHIHHDSSCPECVSQEYCKSAAEETCGQLGCSQDQLVQRSSTFLSALTPANMFTDTGTPGTTSPPSMSLPDPTYFPRIHVGKMASGDLVLKNSAARDEYVTEHDVIAFDMEGAGVSFVFPTLVIKAGSDYADSHKNDSWQQWAAVTAAACAKAFIEQVQMGIGENVKYYSQESVEPQSQTQWISAAYDNAGPSDKFRWANATSHTGDQPFGPRNNGRILSWPSSSDSSTASTSMRVQQSTSNKGTSRALLMEKEIENGTDVNDLQERAGNLRHHINTDNSAFHKLKLGHIGEPFDDKHNPYWSRVTFEAIDLYKEVFDEMPKTRRGLVSFEMFETYFALFEIPSWKLLEIWRSLGLHGLYGPKNYILACICMVHFYKFKPTLRPSSKRRSAAISDGQRKYLASFGEFVRCDCRNNTCLMEYSFLVHINKGACKGDRDPKCVASKKDGSIKRHELKRRWKEMGHIAEPML